MFKVRQWALVISLLYAAMIAVLFLPLLLGAFWTPPDPLPITDGSVSDVLSIYTTWQFWASIAFLGALELLFLVAPLEVARERPVSRGRWTLLAVTAGLMMGLLVAGFSNVLLEIAYQDHFPGRSYVVFIVPASGVLAWIFWGIAFGWYAFTFNPSAAIRKITDRMINGSIAELLIAVPCHIIVRNKKYCCAGTGTFIGLATGFSVLLFAFGPGILFLYSERIKRLRRENDERPPVDWWGAKTANTRRSIFWFFGAIFFQAGLLAAAAVKMESIENLYHIGRASLIIMSIIASIYALRACKFRETGWKFAAAGAAMLVESIVTMAITALIK